MRRKKGWGRFVYVPLLLAGLLALALYFMPLFPSALTALSVTSQARGGHETHIIDQDAAKGLLAAMQGLTANELPENIQTAYLLTLHPKGMFPRHYEVYVASSREIYLKRLPVGRLIRSENAHFFYIHAAFQDLYQYEQMPDLLLKAGALEIYPRVQQRLWQYLKWDNNWYNGKLPPLSEPSPAWPSLNPAEDQLALIIDPIPDRVSLYVTDPRGETVFDGSLSGTHLPAFQYNGLYDYRLSLSWEDEKQPYRGRYDAIFSVFIELPPAFELPDTIVQGEMAAFYVRHLPQGVMPVFELDIDYRSELFPFEDGYVTYLPTHYGTAPRAYQLSYGLEGEPLREATLVVLPRDFHIQHLRVDARIVASTRNEAAYAQFARYFTPSRESSAAERYYNEPFILPVSGRLTTEFGQTRYVNNEPTSYRHSGLDIAAPTGTPVLATNSGRVALAMYLILTGNTVVIDHGQGLFSVYYHMHELFVEEGQYLERGETIGTVGSTGFSTGPHLHFTMSYYRHNLEPGYFLVGEPITYDNARRHLQGQ